MDRIANSDMTMLADLFDETAARMGLAPAVIEKDFWVCWMLKRLFTIDGLEGKLLLKGGTSLSKVFGVVRRFSEDVDLAVDYEMLGFAGQRDPRSDMSHTRRGRILDQMLLACQEYIAGELLDTLRQRVADALEPSREWMLEVSPHDRNVVQFQYPAATSQRLEYIRPMVLLEFGTHAELIPRGNYVVKPYAADEFPDLFTDPVCAVIAITAERTFWEKATILHMEYHRPADKPLPQRYSRHYYDVAVMAGTDIKARALGDPRLLARVTRHKDLFYHCGWARYDLARSGTFRVLPQEDRVPELRRDYQSMAVMMFDPPPAFDDILAGLERLEREINA